MCDYGRLIRHIDEASKKKGRDGVTKDTVLELFEEYHQSVYRMAYAVLKNRFDAEDAVQTVFLKLLSGGTAPREGKEKAWILSVTVNVCRDMLRSAKSHQTEELDDSIAAMSTESSALLGAVLALPQRYRKALHLYYYEGYDQRECAKILGVTPSAVSMRLYRARSILRSKLEGESI